MHQIDLSVLPVREANQLLRKLAETEDIIEVINITSLGSDAELTDLPADELGSILAYLDKHEIPFNGTFQKVVNAGKKLRYANTEPDVRSIPFFQFSGTADY
ncbi:MAG: hypothetical protein ACI8R4_003684 [Paracoccaceae bacterium]|jgi:hypothetical protein